MMTKIYTIEDFRYPDGKTRRIAAMWEADQLLLDPRAPNDPEWKESFDSVGKILREEKFDDDDPEWWETQQVRIKAGNLFKYGDPPKEGFLKKLKKFLYWIF